MQPSQVYGSRRYAWYVAAILTVIYADSFLDRHILSLLVKPIRADLHMDDTQVSLLMGTTFAVAFTLATIPLGRAMDSGNRRLLLSASLALRSVFTLSCSLVGTIPQLFAMRLAAGVGQAALAPAAYSLLCDYFPVQSRSTAISLYETGLYTGSGLAFVLGGVITGWSAANPVVPLIGALRPWQFTIFCVGLPSAVLALLILTVREPHRHERISAGAAPAAAVVRYFKENRRVVLYHHAGFAFLALGGYSAGAWNAAFFMRAHGWGAQQTGIALGLISLIAGPAGAIVGGRLADRLVARGRRDATLRISACAMLIGAAVTPVIYAVSSAKLSAALVVPASVALSICSGLGASSLQQMMPNEMRGQASAIFTLVITMTGLGAGPTLPALLTDYVFRNENSIGTALAIVVGICWLAASILLMKACRPFISTLDTLNRRLADGTAQAAAI